MNNYYTERKEEKDNFCVGCDETMDDYFKRLKEKFDNLSDKEFDQLLLKAGIEDDNENNKHV